MTIKYAFSGSHSVGKTFAALKLARDLKTEHPNMSVGMIQEVARHCPFPINTDATDESALWIFSEQIRKELDYSTKYDILVCDRSIMDTVAYARINKCKYAGPMFQVAEKFVESYDKIIFMTIENNNFLFDDGVRSIDPEFRRLVEEELVRMYNSINVDIEYI